MDDYAEQRNDDRECQQWGDETDNLAHLCLHIADVLIPDWILTPG